MTTPMLEVALFLAQNCAFLATPSAVGFIICCYFQGKSAQSLEEISRWPAFPTAALLLLFFFDNVLNSLLARVRCVAALHHESGESRELPVGTTEAW